MSARNRHHRPGHVGRQRSRALSALLLALALAPACRGARPRAGAPRVNGPPEQAAGSAALAGQGGRRARDADDAGTSTRAGGGHGHGGARDPADAGGPAESSAGGDDDSRDAAGASGSDNETTGSGTPPRGLVPFHVVACGASDAASAGASETASGSETNRDCVVSGEGAELVLRGDVLTPDVVYEGGVVRIDASGVIACAGCDCGDAPAREVSCPGSVISPGFVNPHDHVAYAAEPPRPAEAERYEHRHDWRLGLRGHEAIPYEGGASPVVRAAHELRMLLGGATTIAGGAGHAGLLRNPDVSGLEEGLPTAPADSETFPLDDADGRLLTSGCQYGSHHASADDVERAGAYLAHLGEGIDFAAENELDCALSSDFGLIEASTGVVHAIAVRAERAAELGARHAMVVWSPRSNLSLYGNTAPVPLLRRSGVEVALGTDWLLSGSMNVLRELDCARSVDAKYFGGALGDHALWAMVTTAAARAVGAGNALGRLARGFLADVSVITRHEREPYTAAVAADPADFELILRGGRVLYGRRALVSALSPTSCVELEVCGAAQSVCTDEAGLSLAELVGAAAETYPLFTCDAPPNEPSCVPARPLEYDGIPTESDRDGDGRANADDLCPDVFDPVRPLDLGVQADSDGDGRGDACDPCPLDPAANCRDLVTGDRDGDGVADGADRCPDAADAAQYDSDGDGRGDACDFCPHENPGVLPCPLALREIRDPASPSRPPRHARLALEGAVVTALRPDSGSARGFYVADGALPFSGLFVYTAGASPGVTLGDQVSLDGRMDEYYGVDQLVLGALLGRAAGPAKAPIDLDASALGDFGALARPYDSMLVRITGARVAETNPDAPSDYDETLLDGALRLDDLLYPALGNEFAPDTVFSAVTGIAGTSFEHQKLFPREANDFEP